ncbi:hypothetical protein [Luteolibacter soli]|uniref:Uncharacterized protein n=1 Tax=Luteolibacter soli TaxID=3135280 RepID=A0ABU9B4J0_9BACT
MKKPIILLAVALVSMFAAPAAEARGCGRVYVSFHRSCGGPAWLETYIAFYDRCGHPIFRTRIIPARRHYYARPSCPPPAYYHDYGSRGCR